MDNELTRLQERVAALETALAAQPHSSAHWIRRASTLAFLAGMVVAFTVMLNTGGPLRAQGGGPAKVRAPFLVQDAAGKTLVSVNESSERKGFGSLYIYGGDVPGMRLSADVGGSGRIDILGDGKEVSPSEGQPTARA